MLSNHYPSMYANSAVIPLVVTLVIVAGAVIRHFYNMRHASHGNTRSQPWWAWLVAILALWSAFWVAMSASPGGREQLGLPPAPPAKGATLSTPAPTEVANVIAGRCAMCHADEPSWPGIHIAPRNVRLHTPEAVAREADAIRVQAVMTQAMPPFNVTGMTPEERRLVAAWLSPRQ